MQGSGEEGRPQRCQQPEDGKRDRGAERGGEETTAGAGRHHHSLGAIARSGRLPAARLGRGKEAQPRQQQRCHEHHERHEQRMPGPLRQRTGDQPAETETTEVGPGRDDLRVSTLIAVQL